MKKSLNFKGKIILEALLVGLAAGLFVVLFKISITKIFNFVQTFSKNKLFLLPFFCAFGGLVSGFLVNKFAPETKGSGIPYVKAALLHLGNLTRIRSIFVKFCGGNFSIGFGMSLGREGPSVQLGAGAGALIGKIFKLNGSDKDKLICAGSASAIAATFNAPIAGCLFALEELMQKFNSSVLFPVLIATVSASYLARKILGNDTSFLIPKLDENTQISILSCALIGLLAGVLGVLFSKLIHLNNSLFSKIKINPILKPALAGFVAGSIGIFLPLVMGSGTNSVDILFQGKLCAFLILLIFIFKFFLTPFCFGSGAVGGIFLPMLMLGAYLGAIVGILLNHFGFETNTLALSLVSMAAFLSSVARTPITATVMVFEMTNGYDLILYIMLASAISDIVAQKMNHKPIYSELILKQAKDFPFIKKLKENFVKDVYKKEVETLDLEMNLKSALEKIENINHNFFPVIDENKKVYGGITKIAMEDSLINSNNSNLKIKDIMNTNILKIQKDLSLYNLLYKFHFADCKIAPVVDFEDKLLGIISRCDIQEKL